MIKNAITIKVPVDNIKHDRTSLQVWQHATNSNVFTDAVDKFKYYPNPVAYPLNDFYYVVNRFGSLAAILDLGVEEIELDVIELNQSDIIEFLLAFQYHAHKEPKPMAELFRLTLEYIATSEGEKWIKGITQSVDKEDRFSALFGTSKHAAKCYLKLIQPGNESFLDLLAEQKNYSLTKAYNDCIEKEKQAKNPAYSTPEKATTEATVEKQPITTSIVKYSGSESSNETYVEDLFDLAVPEKQGKDEDDLADHLWENRNISSVILDKDNAETSTGDPMENESSDVVVTETSVINQDDFTEHLKKYQKGNQNQDYEDITHKLAKKAILIMSDGNKLELEGEIRLSVDGSTITSTNQLRKLPNGDWALPENYDKFLLIINKKEDTNADASDEFFAYW